MQRNSPIQLTMDRGLGWLLQPNQVFGVGDSADP